ncbi:hypothetical protein ACVW16_004169 [Bradyrhizobium sp. USDA 4474]
MRRLFLGCAVCAAIFVGQANAQAPKEIVSTDTIEVRADQSRTFMFDEPVGRIAMSVDGVAQVTPDTDRTFTIRGLQPGETLLTFYGPDGHVVHRSSIIVQQSRGFVRIYGVRDGRGDLPREFLGFYCTSNGCGRIDPDRVPEPQQVTQGRQLGVDSTTIEQERRGPGPAGAGNR